MRWEDFRRSDNVEDRRGDDDSGGGGGTGIGFGGAGQLGLGTIVILGIIGWALGIDPRVLIGGAEVLEGKNGAQTETTQPQTQAGAPNDQIGQFVAAILAETEDVWTQILPAQKGCNIFRPISCFTAARRVPDAAAPNPPWGPSIVPSIKRSISTRHSSAT